MPLDLDIETQCLQTGRKYFTEYEVKYIVHYKIEKPDAVTNVFHVFFKKNTTFSTHK